VVDIRVKRFSLEHIDDATEFYLDYGYVIFHSFFQANELEAFRHELKEIINAYLKKAALPRMDTADDHLLSHGMCLLESIDHEYIAAVYDTVIGCPSFLRICGYHNTELVVKKLLSIPSTNALYGFTNRCRIDPPNDDRRTYGWHQEVFYTIPKSHFVQTWAPLVFDTSKQNGTIEVAPFSHKEGIAKQTWNDLDTRATQILIDESIMQKYSKIPIEMRTGEMLFFSGNLAHRSGTNTSGMVRYSLVGMYHDVDSDSFIAPRVGFEFRNQSPRQFFNEIFPNNLIANKFPDSRKI
jgi:ectoine hydroxylase-related dioxygenase (phytanoyl-CoA dioxygenase family)